MVVLRELGGQFAIFSYAAYFFRNAGVGLNPLTCTVLVGVMRLASTLACAALLDHAGRRSILTVGCSCCAISSAIGGVFLVGEIPGYSWVALIAVLSFVLGYGFGVGPIPWILIGELLPTPIRVVGASIVTFLFAAMQFIVGLMFPKLMEEVGFGGGLIFFAVFNTFLLILIRMFLPETTSQSIHILEHAFSNTKSIKPKQNIAVDQKTDPVDKEEMDQQHLL